MKIGNGKLNEKIQKNSVKIKVSIVVVLIALLIFRIFFSDKSNIPKFMEQDVTWPLVFVQYVMIPLEMLALFLKKKPATVLSIINIGVSMIIISIEAVFLFILIFLVMLGANLELAYGLTVEIILNAVFCIAAGTVIVIKEV